MDEDYVKNEDYGPVVLHEDITLHGTGLVGSMFVPKCSNNTAL